MYPIQSSRYWFGSRLAKAIPLLALLLPAPLSAAVRITEGVFDRCFYGNRGGVCYFRDVEGKEYDIPMPVDAASPVKWFIDGKDTPYAPMDGGFFVPAHPAFEQDHDAIDFEKGQHPFQGCALRIIEKPGSTQIFLETTKCK